MDKALVFGVEMDAQTFADVYGPEYAAKGAIPTCKECHVAVHPYGMHSADAVKRFDHPNRQPNDDPLDDCVLARRTMRFAGMEPRGHDEAAGDEIRCSFFQDENLAKAYSFCLGLCRRGNLPVEKFREMIARADRRRVWSYVGMRDWLMPYALLTLADFQTATYRFHFVFKPPRGSGPSAVLDDPDRCRLSKMFDGGEPVKAADNPIVVSKPAFVEKAGDVSWIRPPLLRTLKSM